MCVCIAAVVENDDGRMLRVAARRHRVRAEDGQLQAKEVKRDGSRKRCCSREMAEEGECRKRERESLFSGEDFSASWIEPKMIRWFCQ